MSAEEAGFLFIYKNQATVFVGGLDEDAAKEQVHKLLPLCYRTAGHGEVEINEDDLVVCPVFSHEGLTAIAWAPMVKP